MTYETKTTIHSEITGRRIRGQCQAGDRYFSVSETFFVRQKRFCNRDILRFLVAANRTSKNGTGCWLNIVFGDDETKNTFFVLLSRYGN